MHNNNNNNQNTITNFNNFFGRYRRTTLNQYQINNNNNRALEIYNPNYNAQINNLPEHNNVQNLANGFFNRFQLMNEQRFDPVQLRVRNNIFNLIQQNQINNVQINETHHANLIADINQITSLTDALQSWGPYILGGFALGGVIFGLYRLYQGQQLLMTELHVNRQVTESVRTIAIETQETLNNHIVNSNRTVLGETTLQQINNGNSNYQITLDYRIIAAMGVLSGIYFYIKKK